MAWAFSRRFERSIKTRYLFRRLPLIHLLVMVAHLTLLAKLGARYNAYYNRRPVVTMMVTNAILFGIADTVAQTITAIRTRTHANTLPSYTKDSDDPIPLHPLSKGHGKGPTGVLISKKEIFDPATRTNLNPAFDFERLSRFVVFGFCVAPLQYRWLGFLSRTFPMVKDKGAFGQTIKRVTLDQLVFAPFGLTLFFSVMTIAEGGGRRAVSRKMRDTFIPTLKANYMVWPLVQLLNFGLIPLKFQLPFGSTVGIAWTAYLSLTNATENEVLARMGSQTSTARQA